MNIIYKMQLFFVLDTKNLYDSLLDFILFKNKYSSIGLMLFLYARSTKKHLEQLLKKGDVVRDQIEAAIKLFVIYEYHVSVHTLASAAK